MQDPYHSPHPQRRVSLGGGVGMAYVDTGQAEGPPIVFLHGNPTSSYLWRNVIPYVAGLGRCLAPDLVGMGNSDPSPDRAYRFLDHARYLDAWFDALGLDRDLVLVGHDWGAGLALYRAQRFPDQVKGIVYMEGIVRPRRWADYPAGRDEMFRKLRGPEGERLALDENFFVETVLPRSIQRDLTPEEMAAYRAPYATRESRLPTLVWPRELPIDGEPADVARIVEAYGRWAAGAAVPKLFVNGEPGAVIVGESREFCRGWSHQTEVTVRGIHYLQEDSPAEIGAALAGFLRGLDRQAGSR